MKYFHVQVGKLTATNLDRRDNAVITTVIVYIDVKDFNNNSPTSS